MNVTNNVLIQYTSLIVIDEKSDLSNSQREETKSSVVFDASYYLSSKYKHINGSSRILSRKRIDAFPKLNPNCQTEDTTILFRAFLYGKVSLLADKLVKYRVHGANLSSSKNLKKMNIDSINNQYHTDLIYSFKKSIINKNLYSEILKKNYDNKIKRMREKSSTVVNIINITSRIITKTKIFSLI